jgi:small subunit ribosomal protein S8
MSHTDPIADLLIRIKNAYLAKLQSVVVPYSKTKEQIVKVLKDKEFIADYSVEGEKQSKEITVDLLYKNGKSVFTDLKRESTPGLRKYTNYISLSKHINQLGTTIISSSKGIMSADEARKKKVGGELICRIW